MPGTTNASISNFDKIDPSQCVNAKLRKLHRLLNAAYMKKIKPFGLQGSMLSILFIIGKREHVNQKFIAEELVLDQSTMSRDLKRLVDKGWVRKVKGEDLRHTALELTRNGNALLEKVSPVWADLHASIEARLGEFMIQQIDQMIMAVKGHSEPESE